MVRQWCAAIYCRKTNLGFRLGSFPATQRSRHSKADFFQATLITGATGYCVKLH